MDRCPEVATIPPPVHRPQSHSVKRAGCQSAAPGRVECCQSAQSPAEQSAVSQHSPRQSRVLAAGEGGQYRRGLRHTGH